tara:strand:- start:1073 stop:1351 length:279 start_codon:yes stop_codon:yes gene_type:complete
MSKVRKNGARSRADRRMDANGRQEFYGSLTLEQKIQRLPINGESKKELGRLQYELQYGRKKGKGNPTNITNRKDDKPSRKERWETKQGNIGE